MTKKSVQSVMNERVLLSQFHSPFVVNMHYAFQDRDTLYLVLDLMEGGDLRYHIGNRIFNEMQSSNASAMFRVLHRVHYFRPRGSAQEQHYSSRYKALKFSP